MPQPDDQILIQGLLHGEEGAYRYLFSRYYEPMCVLAASILHDDFLAQATVSDVISHLYEVREEITIRTNLRSYLMTSTRNACLNALGTKVKRTEQNLSALSDSEVRSLLGGTDSTTPQGMLLGEEFSQMVQDFIEDLPENVRNSFVKSRYDGMTYREIAKEEGVSANTIKERIKNALQLFERRFHKYLTSLTILPLVVSTLI